MSAIAEAPVARKGRRAAEAPSARKERRTPTAPVRSRAPFAGGVAWIVLIGVLLAGIVAVNVLVLQLNMQFDGLSRERAQLKADNARLRSQLSSASANVRIEEAATAKLGLRAADPLTTTYVRLGER
jgi:cell division protein FtsL